MLLARGRFTVRAALWGLSAAVLLAPSSAWAQLNVQAYAIDNFQSGECGGSDRSWSDMIGNWYFNMAIFGHDLTRFRVDGDFKQDLLCDPDTGIAGCKDHNYADSADVVMVGVHGAHSGSHWEGTMRKKGGPSGTDCKIAGPDGPGNGELFLGDQQTEFLHLSSCNSMDDDYMPTLWRLFEDTDSAVNGRRLHQATGFHGMMAIGPGYHPDYALFTTAAHFISIKDAWMDTMYHPEMENVKCPVAYAVGTGKNNCFNRIDTETYANLFSDPSAINYYCYYFYDRCDPALEDPFVPPDN